MRSEEEWWCVLACGGVWWCVIVFGGLWMKETVGLGCVLQLCLKLCLIWTMFNF